MRLTTALLTLHTCSRDIRVESRPDTNYSVWDIPCFASVSPEGLFPNVLNYTRLLKLDIAKNCTRGIIAEPNTSVIKEIGNKNDANKYSSKRK
jgi:hypothetical protein